MSDFNFYDPVTQPALHAAFAADEPGRDVTHNGTAILLSTLKKLDKLAEQLQRDFIADVCLTYNGSYVSSRGSILFALTDAVRIAAIRIEQVPADLRDEVTAMVKEAAR